MDRQSLAVGLTGLLVVALATARCRDDVCPARYSPGVRAPAISRPTGIALNQTIGTLNDGTLDGDSSLNLSVVESAAFKIGVGN